MKKKVCAAIRCAATFHNEVEELVDVEEVCQEDKNNLSGFFGFKETEGRKHRMVRAVRKVKKKLQCLMCGMRSLYDRVLGVCVCVSRPKVGEGEAKRR